LARTKTTILVDDRVLEQIRNLATSKHGTSRMMSAEIEEALRAFSPLETIKALAARLDVKVDKYPSLDEVSRSRPRLATSAGKTVRKMRDERSRRLLGHQ